MNDFSKPLANEWLFTTAWAPISKGAIPRSTITGARKKLARKLIYRDLSAGDPLQVYLQHFAGNKGKAQAAIGISSQLRSRTA